MRKSAIKNRSQTQRSSGSSFSDIVVLMDMSGLRLPSHSQSRLLEYLKSIVRPIFSMHQHQIQQECDDDYRKQFLHLQEEQYNDITVLGVEFWLVEETLNRELHSLSTYDVSQSPIGNNMNIKNCPVAVAWKRENRIG